MNSMFCPRKNVFLMKTQICEECEYCDIRLFFWRLPGIGISRRNHSICTTFIPPDVTPIIPSTVQKIQFGFLCWWFADVITILSHRYMNVYFYPARELLQTCCGFLSCLGTRFNIRWELTSSWRRAGNMYVLSVAEWLARDAMDGVGRLTLTIVVFDYGWRLSTMVDFCNDSPWMELVDNREKFSLFSNSRSPIRVVRKVFLLAQPQSVLHFWDVCDWFRFIISLHFSERCKVTRSWGYGVCTVNEICANTQDLCERSDLLAPFERLQASQSHRLTPLICIGQCLFGAWKFWKANQWTWNMWLSLEWKADTHYLQILILMLRLFCTNLRVVAPSGQRCN